MLSTTKVRKPKCKFTERNPEKTLKTLTIQKEGNNFHFQMQAPGSPRRGEGSTCFPPQNTTPKLIHSTPQITELYFVLDAGLDAGDFSVNKTKAVSVVTLLLGNSP